MPETIRIVIAWTCVGVFIASSIITLLALVRVIRLPNPKYLSRLFTVIIVAIVGNCATIFQEYVSPGGGITNTNSVSTTEGMVSTGTDPVKPSVVAKSAELAAVRAGTVRTNVVARAEELTKKGGASAKPIVVAKVEAPALKGGGAIATNAALPGGWLGFRHSGAYVAKFYLSWVEDGQPKSWSSGRKTAGYSDVIQLKESAREIKLAAQAATGLVWSPWGTIFSLDLTNGPPNKFFVAQGTTLNRKWTTAER